MVRLKGSLAVNHAVETHEVQLQKNTNAQRLSPSHQHLVNNLVYIKAHQESSKGAYHLQGLDLPPLWAQ